MFADSKTSEYASLSEAEDLVNQFADRSWLLVPKRLGGFLHGADHRWRTADKDLDIFRRRGQAFLVNVSGCSLSRYRHDASHLYHVRCAEANASVPNLGWTIEDIIDSEAIVLSSELVEVILQ